MDKIIMMISKIPPIKVIRLRTTRLLIFCRCFFLFSAEVNVFPIFSTFLLIACHLLFYSSQTFSSLTNSYMPLAFSLVACSLKPVTLIVIIFCPNLITNSSDTLTSVPALATAPFTVIRPWSLISLANVRRFTNRDTLRYLSNLMIHPLLALKYFLALLHLMSYFLFYHTISRNVLQILFQILHALVYLLLLLHLPICFLNLLLFPLLNHQKYADACVSFFLTDFAQLHRYRGSLLFYQCLYAIIRAVIYHLTLQ